jgi:hypothetical protein
MWNSSVIITISMLLDDGIRLWVDDQMLIDAWVPQPPTEWIGSIDLEVGKNILSNLNFEEGGGALCRLFGAVLTSLIVLFPVQLFPENTTSTLMRTFTPNAYTISNPRTIFSLCLADQWNEVMEIEINNVLGQQVFQRIGALES